MFLLKTFLFFSIVVTCILNFVFVKLHRGIQNTDIKCQVIERLLDSYEQILKNDSYFSKNWHEAISLNHNCLLSSATNFVQNGHDVSEITSQSNPSHTTSPQSRPDHIDQIKQEDESFSREYERDKENRIENTDSSLVDPCFNPMNSISKWNQYIGYWRFRNHFLKIADEFQCKEKGWNSTLKVKQQFVEESMPLELYPFIVKLHIYAPEDKISSNFDKSVFQWIKNVVYEITRILLSIVLIDFELKDSYSYYYSLEEGYLGVRKRYGVPTIQANISITDPLISSIFKDSHIPDSIQTHFFRISPLILGHEALVNNFFIQQSRIKNATDFGYLLSDRSSEYLKLRKFSLQASSNRTSSFKNYGLLEFYSGSISPLIFYIFLYVANLFVLRTCLSHLLYGIRIIEYYNHFTSVGRIILGLGRILAELEIRFFAIYYLMMYGLYHLVSRYIGNRVLSELLIWSILIVQCISISRVNKMYASLYMEVFNVIIAAYLTYIRMYPITGVHPFAFLLAIGYTFCVSGLLFLFVKNFSISNFEGSIIQSWLNSESNYLTIDILIHLVNPIETTNPFLRENNTVLVQDIELESLNENNDLETNSEENTINIEDDPTHDLGNIEIIEVNHEMNHDMGNEIVDDHGSDADNEEETLT